MAGDITCTVEQSAKKYINYKYRKDQIYSIYLLSNFIGIFIRKSNSSNGTRTAEQASPAVTYSVGEAPESVTDFASDSASRADRQNHRQHQDCRPDSLPVLQLSLSLSLSLPARRFAWNHYVNFNFPHKNKLFLLDVGNTFQHMQRVWHAHHASLHVSVCVSLLVMQALYL